MEVRLSNSCPGVAAPGYMACGGQVSSEGCPGCRMKGLGPKIRGGSLRPGWWSYAADRRSGGDCSCEGLLVLLPVANCRFAMHISI